MKIALVQTPCWGLKSPPYGVASLSAYLKKNGHDTFKKDLNIDAYHYFDGTDIRKYWSLNEGVWGDLKFIRKLFRSNRGWVDAKVDELLSSGAGAIGFTVLWSTQPMSICFAEEIKKRDASKIVIFGGPQCERKVAGEWLVSLPEVDFVVPGEGEVTLTELLSALDRGEDGSAVRGVLYKKDHKGHFTGDRPQVRSLADLPFADFDGFDFNLYAEEMRTVPLSSSRGCPNKCIYCDEVVQWKYYRANPAERIFAELKYQLDRHGVRRFEFADSLVNGKVDALEKFCDMVIAEDLNIAWMGQAVVRPEMTRDLLDKIRRSGCFHLCFGVEHSNPELMKKIGKILIQDTNLDDLMRNAHEVGLGIGVNWMFGFPGETDQDMEDDLAFFDRNARFLSNIFINNSPGFCGFTPGCSAYHDPDEFDIVLGPDPITWKSKDGSNTYLTRMRKFQRFSRHLKSLGVPLSFEPFANENELTSNYYRMERQYGTAAKYMLASLKQEGVTVKKTLKMIDNFAKSVVHSG